MSKLLSLCCATSSLGNPFVEAPLPSAIWFFSAQLLIWATSALSCLPAASSATQFFCSRIAYNAFSNLHLQSRKAQEWHYGLKLPFMQLLHCVWQPPAAIPRTRSVAASLPLWCAQPCQCVLSQPVEPA